MRIALLIVALAASAPLLFAGDSPEHDLTKADVQERFARTLSVDFKKQPLDAVLSLFMEFTKTTILTDPALAKQKLPPINFSATDAPILESFTKALDATGTEWAVLDNAVFVFKKGDYGGDPARLTRPFSDADAQVFAKAVADLRDGALATREDASKTLAQFGPAALPSIKTALETEKDPEAIDRLKTLQKIAGAATFFQPLAPGVAQELETRTETVNAWYSDGVSRCVETLNETLRARVKLQESTAANSDINLRIMQMPVRSVLIWVARYTRMRLTVQNGRLVMGPKEQ